MKNHWIEILKCHVNFPRKGGIGMQIKAKIVEFSFNSDKWLNWNVIMMMQIFTNEEFRSVFVI